MKGRGGGSKHCRKIKETLQRGSYASNLSYSQLVVLSISLLTSPRTTHTRLSHHLVLYLFSSASFLLVFSFIMFLF